MVNKTNEDKKVTLEVLDIDATVQIVGIPEIVIPARGQHDGTIFVKIDPDKLESPSEKIKVGVFEEGKQISVESTNFIGPMSFK